MADIVQAFSLELAKARLDHEIQEQDDAARKANSEAAESVRWNHFCEYLDVNGFSESDLMATVPGGDHLNPMPIDAVVKMLRGFLAYMKDKPAVVHYSNPGITRPRKLSSIKAAFFTVIKILRRDFKIPIHSSHEDLKKAIRGIDNQLAQVAIDTGIKVDIKEPKSALGPDDVKRIIAHIYDDPNQLKAARDRAVIAFAFAGCFRRSELATWSDHDRKRGLYMIHLERTPKGYRVRLPETKGGKEQVKFIARLERADYCPVTLMDEWISVTGIVSGPVFRATDKHGNVKERGISPGMVSVIFKDRLIGAGYSADEVKRYASHSARRGFITELVNQGKHPDLVIAQSGHSSVDMLRDYTDKSKLEANPISRDVWG